MSIKVILSNVIVNGKKLGGRTIVFKDSYLLLPLSLRKLCTAFNIILSKGFFPFNLNDIFYSGLLPEFAYWSGITKNEYESLVAKFTGKVWSFKEEAIKYCKLDCKTLHEILTKFNELIFNEFQINIHKSITLPSLAMRIFKSHYLVKDTIYQLLGKVEGAIRESYTGGAVDVYIPHNRIGSFFLPVKAFFTKLYYYDVNSLYPTVMSKFNMPVGKPIAFEGDIRQVEPLAFGFFYCKITSPEKLLHPILQRSIKGKGTVAGLGTWYGWIPSIEMDNAVKYGYTFDILKGYQFEQANIFKEYVNKMYNLRLQYEKGTPMNLIAKLLLNSLYGKFGMKLEKTVYQIFNLNTDSGKLALRSLLDTAPNTVKEFIEFDDNKYIFAKNALAEVFNEQIDTYHGSDVNVAISSTISAGARIFMSAFKNNRLYNLYYSDTDSIVIDSPLNPLLVGSTLGLLKLEYVISKAVFLAPKVYAFITVDGEEVIKGKGLTRELVNNLHFADLEALLVEDSSRLLTQEKWYKNLTLGEITIKDVLYNLKVTTNKREAIYVNGIFTKTKPLYYDEIINK